MKGRLLVAALAVAALASCKSDRTKTLLLEKDGRFAIAYEKGKKIEVYPLPKEAVVVSNGEFGTVSAGGGGAGIMPLCPCKLERCLPYCRPFAQSIGFDPPDVGGVRPGGAPATDPAGSPPGGAPTGQVAPGGQPAPTTP